jgi:hypothetical protein
VNSKIKVLGLLGLPLLAIAVAVMVFAFNPATDTTEAATDGASMSLSIGGASGKADVGNGSVFTVVVSADSIPTGTGYTGVQAWVNYGAGGLAGKGNQQALWADCEPATFVSGASGNAENGGCLTGLIGGFDSFLKGDVFSFDITCDDNNSHTIGLLALGDVVASTSGAGFDTSGGQVPAANIDIGGGVLVAASIDVNCIPATDTPTTPPTATPPPIPRMSKAPALQNVFLTRQGSKIPPGDCLSGTNVAGLSEALGQEIVTLNKFGETQSLGAFEFEVHYDAKKACVVLSSGTEFDAAGICIIQDSSSKPQLEGVARIGCVTLGKGHDIDELVALAQIDVYPQPDLYSEMKPNQENGNTVQINNVNCDISDDQGEAIAIFSCDDADITFRYLEGDVEPDCVIDAVDAQAIAFRWGVTKGSLIYKDFMNLEPSNQQADNDIDINDLQFVFGRFGSSCEAPHPPQDPVNPKA